MPVAIPEHTVDVWAGILIDRAFPTARIWAPTQLSSPDFDLASKTREGKLFVLENKAPNTTELVGCDYAIRIDRASSSIISPTPTFAIGPSTCCRARPLMRMSWPLQRLVSRPPRVPSSFPRVLPIGQRPENGSAS
jgi:hypothetical protein